MRAVLVTDDGSLAWSDAAEPVPGPGDALVDVVATAVNRADLSQRAGSYGPPPGESDVLGLECAGIVRSAPAGSRFRPGDAVCALLAGGGYAEVARVPEALLMPVPRGWTFAQAAAMPEVFFTAYLNLVIEGGLRPGERALVHGGASGVGTAAIQVARHLGCEVAATAGGPEKVRACRELGADPVVDHRTEDFAEVVRARFPEGVDVVLDMVGADTVPRDLEVLRLGGRIVVIATLSGSRTTVDLRMLMTKRAVLRGSTLRHRTVEEKAAIGSALVAALWPAFEDGTVAPVIDAVVPIEEAEDAHARMRSNANVGKIVLAVRPGAGSAPGRAPEGGRGGPPGSAPGRA